MFIFQTLLTLLKFSILFPSFTFLTCLSLPVSEKQYYYFYEYEHLKNCNLISMANMIQVYINDKIKNDSAISNITYMINSNNITNMNSVTKLTLFIFNIVIIIYSC